MMYARRASGNPGVWGDSLELRVMAIRELTWEEVRDLDRGRTMAILPVGAIEAYGPHLPLGTDVFIAHAMARAGGARIEARSLRACSCLVA